MGLPVNVDLPLAIGIPETYVPDTNLRLRLYRRLADLTDEAALEALAAEFTDRFGPLPEMITNLFYQMRVKLRAEQAGLVSIGMESGQIVLRYPPSPEGREAKAPARPGSRDPGREECLLVFVWEGRRLAGEVAGSTGKIAKVK